MQYNNRGGGKGKYGNSGALFDREKRNTNSPEHGGEFTISDEVLEYVLDQARNGEVKLELVGWDAVSGDGDPYVSLRINIPWKVRQAQEEQGQSRPQQRQPRGNYGQQSGRADFRGERQRDERPVRGANVPGRGRQPMSDREFSKGDRMPSFNLDDDDDSPPFDR